MADIIVEAEVKSNIGQLNKDLEKTADNAVSLKKTFRLASGAVSATQGAMKLLGTDSERVDKAILQVQAAMAMNQGLNTLMDQADTIKSIYTGLQKWSVMQKVINALQWLWNAAMSANPIGAIVLSVTALIAAGTALVKMFKSSSKASNKNTASIDKQTAALQRNLDQMKLNLKENDREREHQLDMSKARGATSEAIRKQEVAIIQLALADRRAMKEELKNAVTRAKLHHGKIARLNDDGKATDQQRKRAKNAMKQAFKDRDENQKAIDALKEDAKNTANRHLVEIAAEETNDAKDRVKRAKDTAKQLRQNKLEENKQKIQDEKDLQEELEQIEADALMEKIDLETKLLNEGYDRERSAEERELNAVYDKYFALLTAKEANGEDITELTEMQEKEILAIQDKFAKKGEKLDDDKTKFTKDSIEEQLGAISGLTGALGKIAGDNKELAAASAIIDTYAGANKAFGVGGPAGFATGAAIILQGLANVQKIYDTPIAGDTGGSTPPATPPAPQMMSGAFSLEQTEAPEAFRAYVVTDEMTNSQNQLANIRRRATI